ncbi:MAG TPA: FtsQ-type POTRA domain-containing protein [Capillimicrobium sp.]|nr:FtsQ-type POTRA domain-containing protein [Capillimicrobium sp.]
MVAAVLHRLPRLPRLRVRTWAVVAVLLAAAAAGGWLWLRDSSLVRVEQVEITGVTGAEKASVEAALRQAAEEMTTLHVDAEALRAAVERYPQVKNLSVEADPLHRLRIAVEERPPVAALTVGDERTPVAADGTLLTGHASDEGLPEVDASALPAGGRLTGGDAATALAVVAAAPEAMRRYVERVSEGPEGLEAQLRDGPRVILGTADRAYAKWIATGRVLNDPGADGAGYIDVRLPERPAAGGFPGGVVPSS